MDPTKVRVETRGRKTVALTSRMTREDQRATWALVMERTKLLLA